MSFPLRFFWSYPVFIWQVAHVFLGARGANPGERLLVGSSKKVEDLVKLVDIVATLEEWAAAQELGQNTADGPNINFAVSALVARLVADSNGYKCQMNTG